MSTKTNCSKGETTISIGVLNHTQLNAGDRIESVAATQEVTELKRMFGGPKKIVSIAAMNTAIAQRGAAKR